MKITVLGSGTSVGVPMIGCHCAVCLSDDPRDKRLRPSVLFRIGDKSILIDTTPDFRQQALRAHIERIDAILYTHSHADHVLGLDDVRPFNFRQGNRIPIYGAPETIDSIRHVFQYVFLDEPTESSIPKIDTHKLNGLPFELLGETIIPVKIMHGRQPIYGFRIGAAAYLTDHSEIPEESVPLLEGLDVLFLDALRHKPHPTHSTVARSLETVAKLAPKRTYFTHICHDLGHQETEAALPENVRLAYDGMELEVE